MLRLRAQREYVLTAATTVYRQPLRHPHEDVPAELHGRLCRLSPVDMLWPKLRPTTIALL